MKKRIPIVAVCLLALTAIAATTVWYSSMPPTTGIVGSDGFTLEHADPHGYVYATMDEVAAYAGTNGIWRQSGGSIFPVISQPVGIFYDISTNSGTSLLFSTTLFNSTNVNISASGNLNAVKSGGPTYSGTLSLSSLNGAHAATMGMSASSTASGSTTVLNAFSEGVPVFTLDGNGLDTVGRVNSLSSSVTNGYYNWTNTWANAPTGTVDMAITDQALKLTAGASITGIINKSNYVSQPVVMTFTNSTAANQLITLAAGISIPQRTNQVALSNASVGTLSLRWHPAIGTNGVWVQF